MRAAHRRAALAVLGVLGFSTTAFATPYWVAWEGDDWPENKGWTRIHGPQGAQAQRTLGNGHMTLDGLNPPVYDYYRIEEAVQSDPGPEEEFVMQWRVRVEEVVLYPNDVSIAVVSSDSRIVGLSCEMSQLRSVFEGVSIPYAPGEFHTYELRSSNMLGYNLMLDGTLAFEGAFVQTVGPSFVAWGDGGYFAGSRTTWDYFRFGIVPEADSTVFLVILGIAGPRWFRACTRG